MTRYPDTDGDTYGDEDHGGKDFCDPPSDWVADHTDCNDGDGDTHPGAPEDCTSADRNCDGSWDYGATIGTTTWYRDYDGDTWGSATFGTRDACTAPEGYVYSSTDCDDYLFEAHPGGTEVCDPYNIDEDCDGGADDDDPDEDVLEGMSTWYPDYDGDEFGDEDFGGLLHCDPPTSSWLADHTDCDDGDEDTYPGATEVCDAADTDEDCDGGADDDDPEGDATGKTTWYLDSDEDEYGDPAVTTTACDLPAGYVADYTDCDDDDYDTNPGADEYCDATDHDCDGSDTWYAVDGSLWYRDHDGDGYGHPWLGYADAGCGTPTTGYVLCEDCVEADLDCDDWDDETYPGATEVCTDGDDNDCDGDIDTDDDDCTCPEGADLGSSLGLMVALAATTGYSSDHTPSSSCVGSWITSGPDKEHNWTAPYDGCYIFDTDNSYFNTVLMLYDECYGTEIACNDDVDDPFDEDFARSDGSRIVHELDADESVLVVVDGYSSATGIYRLGINRSNLSSDADVDLGSEIGWYVYEGTTLFGGSDYTASCGASSDSPDILLHWTAPAADYYAFWLDADEFDTVLSLYQGSECTSTSDLETEVACTDTYAWGGGGVLARSMDEGEQILIRVAGYGAGAYGDFAVHILGE